MRNAGLPGRRRRVSATFPPYASAAFLRWFAGAPAVDAGIARPDDLGHVNAAGSRSTRRRPRSSASARRRNRCDRRTSASCARRHSSIRTCARHHRDAGRSGHQLHALRIEQRRQPGVDSRACGARRNRLAGLGGDSRQNRACQRTHRVAHHVLRRVANGARTPRREVNANGAPLGYGGRSDRCTGCEACVAACRAENNIPDGWRPAVFARSRHALIRVERYFEGDFRKSG